MTDMLKSFAAWAGNGPVDYAVKVILALVVYIVGSKVIGKVCRLVRRRMLKFGTDEAAKSFLLSFVKIGLHALLIFSIAGNLGVNETSIAALLGSAGVALSLALQGGLSNFAGGLIILFLRPFSVGDYIIENSEKNEGTVQKIELYYTTLLTVDSRQIVIPNSMLTNASIVNVTAMDRRRLEIKVGISYDSDLLLAKQILREVILANEGITDREDIQVYVDSLGDSSVNLAARVWVLTDNYWQVKWELNEKVKLAFDEKGILIPYPQMEVTVRGRENG